MAELKTFSVPTEIIAGLGIMDELPDRLTALRIRNPALVCDEGLQRAGLLDPVLERLTARVAATISVTPDPSIADAEHASRLARAAGVDGVLAVGGGSGLAVGKAVAARLTNPVPLLTLAGGNRAQNRAAPVLAIPTTAGSGSEVSSVFVLRDPAQASAVVFQANHYAPRVAMLDGNFLRSLPRDPMLYAALDALSHCLESLWSRGASTFTNALAANAARHIHLVLPRAVDDRDLQAMQTLLETSSMANLACGNSGLALVHALSLASSVRLPHGYQNGVLLPAVAAFNRPVVDMEIQAEIDRLYELYERVRFVPRFQEGEVNQRQADAMIAVALASPLRNNNIRVADEADIREILARVLPECQQLTAGYDG